MHGEQYRYEFEGKIPRRDVEESLLLAVLAAESLHGRERVVLDAEFRLDPKARSCVVDASTEVGMAIARLFTGFLSREFGEDVFTVKRVQARAADGGHQPGSRRIPALEPAGEGAWQ